MNMKGQYFSFDAIVASVIFVLAIVALLSYWHSVKAYLDYQNDDLSREAVRISNLLFTPAFPEGSCGDDIELLGLSRSWDEKYVMPSSVLECIEGKDGPWLKDRLKTPFGVHVSVKQLDGTHRDPIAIGSGVPDDASSVVNLRRLASLHNETTGESYLASVDISVYR